MFECIAKLEYDSYATRVAVVLPLVRLSCVVMRDIAILVVSLAAKELDERLLYLPSRQQ